MFCEDAVRRLHRALQGYPQASRFSIRVVHAESLHAHDARRRKPLAASAA
ncbi:GTP cyclohydrolase, FolE2/MptA family [Pseudomonas aeruginosa]